MALYPMSTDDAAIPPPGAPAGDPFTVLPPVNAGPWTPYGVPIPPDLATPPPVVPSFDPQFLPPPPPPDQSALPSQAGQAPAAPPLSPYGVPIPPDLATPPPVDASLVGAPPPVQIPAEPPATPAPQLPDAVSGMQERTLSGPPEAPFTGDAAQGITPEQAYQKVAQQYSRNPDQLVADLIGGGPMTPERQRYLNELALRDPQTFAEVGQRVEDQRQKAITARQLEIANRDYDQQVANMRARDQAMRETQARIAQIDAEAQRLANKKIDPTGGISTVQKIAGVLASIVGGLVQGRSGGPNAGLDALNATIQRGIDAQKADLANQMQGLGARRTALAEQMHLNNDMYTAQETVRLAALKHADDLLKVQQQDFAPDGVRGMRIAALRGGIAAQQAQTLRDLTQKTFDNSIKQQNADRERALALETLRHNRAGEGIEYAKLAIEKSKAAAENAILTPDQIRQQFPSLPPDAVPPTSMTAKQLAQHVETFNKTLETANKTTGNAMQVAGTQVAGPDGKPLTKDGTPNGPPVVISNHELAAKINDSVAGAQELLSSLGNVRRFITSNPSTFDRRDWPGATTELENAKFAFARLHDTKASSRELEAMEKLFGPDPDSYVSRVKDKAPMLAHIDALINDAKATINNKLRRQAQYTGPSVLVDTSKPPPTTSTTSDRDLQTVLAAPASKENPVERPGVEPATVHGLPVSIEMTNRQWKILDGWAQDIRGLDAKEQAQLAADLQRPPDDSLHLKAAKRLQEAEAARANAFEMLSTAAGRGTPGLPGYSPGSNEFGVKEYARRLLQDTIAGGIDATPGAQ